MCKYCLTRAAYGCPYTNDARTHVGADIKAHCTCLSGRQERWCSVLQPRKEINPKNLNLHRQNHPRLAPTTATRECTFWALFFVPHVSFVRSLGTLLNVNYQLSKTVCDLKRCRLYLHAPRHSSCMQALGHPATVGWMIRNPCQAELRARGALLTCCRRPLCLTAVFAATRRNQTRPRLSEGNTGCVC